MSSSLRESDSLYVNRQGDITRQQRDAIVDASNKSGWLGCGLAAVIMVAIVYVAGDWLSQHEIIGIVILMTVLIGSVLLVGRLTSIPMRHRLEHAHAQPVPGEVVWRGANYVPVANNRVLKSLYGSGNLAPGHYTFYCLENSDWLLSAEARSDNAPSASPVMDTNLGGFSTSNQPVGVPQAQTSTNFTASELSRALNATGEFHPDALDANRDGRITGRQRSYLMKDSMSTLFFSLIAFGIVVALIFRAIQTHDNGGQMLLSIGVFALIGVVMLVNVAKELADALGGRVETITGSGSRYTHSTRSSRGNSRTHYYYRINDINFEVPRAAYNAMLEGVIYRAYYAPRTKTLLNIEPAT